MNSQNSHKIRTVSVNSRGQIVIPEDVRQDLDITGESTLVLIERDGEILLKKDSDVLQFLESEDRFWRAMALGSLRSAWEKEDEVWDDLYKKTSK